MLLIKMIWTKEHHFTDSKLETQRVVFGKGHL